MSPGFSRSSCQSEETCAPNAVGAQLPNNTQLGTQLVKLPAQRTKKCRAKSSLELEFAKVSRANAIRLERSSQVSNLAPRMLRRAA